MLKGHNMATTKQELRRKQAAIKAAAALEKAKLAVHNFSMACNKCNDGSQVRRADDGRILLMGSMAEYSGWLSSVYDK